MIVPLSPLHAVKRCHLQLNGERELRQPEFESQIAHIVTNVEFAVADRWTKVVIFTHQARAASTILHVPVHGFQAFEPDPHSTV